MRVLVGFQNDDQGTEPFVTDVLIQSLMELCPGVSFAKLGDGDYEPPIGMAPTLAAERMAQTADKTVVVMTPEMVSSGWFMALMSNFWRPSPGGTNRLILLVLIPVKFGMPPKVQASIFDGTHGMPWVELAAEISKSL